MKLKTVCCQTNETKTVFGPLLTTENSCQMKGKTVCFVARQMKPKTVCCQTNETERERGLLSDK